MHKVLLRVLEGLKIELVPKPRAADLLIVPPSGALLEVYTFPSILRDRLRELPDVPLVIFPSSALFPSIDPSNLFRDRNSATLWFLRESHSYAHLESTWGAQLQAAGVRLILDHDIVLSGHEFVPEILGDRICESTVLVAARHDREAHPVSCRNVEPSAAGGAPDAAPGVLGQLERQALRAARAMPYGSWMTRLSRTYRSGRQRKSGSDLLGRVIEELGEFDSQGRTTIFSDISSPNLATFSEYCREIRRAGLIVTNRLHAALPAALIGKQVFMVEAGYHKLRGVYEHSMRTLDNVTFIGASEASPRG
jgi:exopolysaccharide biosynthesis predicted pyruvyltransferase EpsI